MTILPTISGKQFDLSDPREEMVDIKDIAHALSNINRFNGHTIQPYSVAQHSVFVAIRMPLQGKLEGLMHDAAEAYCCDIPTPLKDLLLGYKKIETAIMKVIVNRFWLDYNAETMHQIAHLDQVALKTEGRDLLPEPFGRIEALKVGPSPTTIIPLCPEDARKQFLGTFNHLWKGEK